MASKKISRLGRGLDSLITGGISSQPKAGSKGAKAEKKKKTESKAAEPKAAAAVAAPAVPEGTVPFPAKEKAAAAPEASSGLLEIAIHRIVPNPHQPRREFNEEALRELSESIRAEGLLQPVVVRKKAEGFELIAGERRWRACQLLKLKMIPARVIEASETSSAILSLIENLQRENLNPIEEAMGYASLIRDFDLTQEAVSERVGKARASIANALRLLQLEREIQGYLGKGMLSTGHAKVLLGIEASEHRTLLARQLIEKGWSVRELERQVILFKGREKGQVANRPAPAAEMTAIKDLEKQIGSRLSTRVQLRHNARKGKLIIEYHGNEDLQRILEKMGLQ